MPELFDVNINETERVIFGRPEGMELCASRSPISLMTMSSQEEGYRGRHQRDRHVTSQEHEHRLSAKTTSDTDKPATVKHKKHDEETNKHRHSSSHHSHHRRREPSGSSRDDEEPSSSRTRDASVETVDRGVGPTPAPPHTSHLDPRNYAPTYYGLPSSFLDPRNGLEQTSPYGASANPYGLPPGFPFYHVPYPLSINPPLPLNSQTLEGRYNWPPPGFHHPMTGLPTSPSHSDVSSLYGLRSPMAPSDSLSAALASRLHWDQLRQNYLPLGSGRRYSPAALQALQGPGFGSSSGYPHDYPGGFSPYGTHSMFTDLPPTPGSGSVTLPGSIDP
ncbi:hypothetical protein DPMN_056829, partial [Dreissena polymorpha]